MIRIRIVRDARPATFNPDGPMRPASVEVREFDDDQKAANWLIEDSYFAESYTKKVTWERID